MLGLFRKARQERRSTPVNRVRLSLEKLEERDCPTASSIDTFSLVAPESTIAQMQPVEIDTTFDAYATTSNFAMAAMAPPESDQAPTITLDISYGSQRMVTLSGQVLDEDPAGLLVTFTGVVQGSVITNPDGTFVLQAEAAALGLIEATTVDVFGNSSNVASVTVASSAPQITDFSGTEGFGRIWTFHGRIVDESAADLVVRFAGLESVNNQMVSVQPDGWFSFIVTLQPEEAGLVTAVATDWWGQESNTAYYVVAPNQAPNITLAITYGTQRMVTLSGQVLDEDPAGLLVTFTGVVQGSVITSPDGTFMLQAEATALGLIEATTIDVFGNSSNVASVTVASSAPQITDISWTEDSNRVWTFRGRVVDESAAGLTVRFAGLGSVEGQTVTVGADSFFSYTVTLQPGEAGLVTAIATDWWGQESNTAYYVVAPNQAPNITLAITYGTQRMVTLSGQVTDENPGGLVVTFTGAAQGSVITNQDGSFSIQLEATALGSIEATTVDSYGNSSNVASVVVASNAPQITEISCTEGINHVWTFRGKVIDESAADLVIRFAGLASVTNLTEIVEADGWFCLIVTLQPDEEGTVTAITSDWWGQDSNIANYIVRQT